MQKIVTPSSKLVLVTFLEGTASQELVPVPAPGRWHEPENEGDLPGAQGRRRVQGPRLHPPGTPPCTQCLHSCPQVKVLGPDSICILASGDALIVRISSQGDKGMSTNEIKKMASSLLKDVLIHLRQIKN